MFISSWDAFNCPNLDFLITLRDFHSNINLIKYWNANTTLKIKACEKTKKQIKIHQFVNFAYYGLEIILVCLHLNWGCCKRLEVFSRRFRFGDYFFSSSFSICTDCDCTCFSGNPKKFEIFTKKCRQNI